MFAFPVLFGGRCSRTQLYIYIHIYCVQLATVNANTFRLQCVQRVLKPLFHQYYKNRSWNQKVCQKIKQKQRKTLIYTHTLSNLLTLEIIAIGPPPIIWLTLFDTRIQYYIILRYAVFENLIIILSEVYQLLTILLVIQKQFLLERYILFLFSHNYACQLNIK